MGTGLSNKLIGQAGEFAVCAQLGKLGLVATPFAGNVPHFDILVSDDQLRTLPLQVKATHGNDGWIVGDAWNWMEIKYDDATHEQRVLHPTQIDHPDLIMVYIWLSKTPGLLDRHFILTKAEVQRILVESYTQWLKKHNGVRPHNPESYHIIITLAELNPFENDWQLIKDRLGASTGLRVPSV